VAAVAVALPEAGNSRIGMLAHIKTLLRHRWRDASSARRCLSRATLKKLQIGIGESERKHSGQIRICVEASLPPSYLWRHFWQRQPLSVVVRQRAVMLFGKLRVWDTEHNNGVLIYLLLAERSIEVVADRGLNTLVSAAQWQKIVHDMRDVLGRANFEEGLEHALQAVTNVLATHFPKTPGASQGNELPDTVVLL